MRRQIQRAAASLTLCAMLAGGLALPARAAGFRDVPDSYWAAEPIRRCVSLGFFQGESANVFGVGHQMTRAAFAVVLSRFFGWETKPPAQPTYGDVPTSAWYYGAVEAAYANGAITRQSDDFRPSEPITREELAVMLVRALGYGTIAGLAQDLPMPFRDVTTNAGYIAMAYELGLVGGTSATEFSPDKTATREQAAVMLMRMYDKLHAPAPGRVGIVSGGELPELTGYDAVALAGGKLIYAGKAQLAMSIPREEAAPLAAAIREAGAKPLLHVTGSANPLKAEPGTVAALLAAAVEEGGYDGLFLDIGKLPMAQETRMTKLAAALRTALGEKLLYVVAEAPAWQGSKYQGYQYGALAASVDRLVLRVAPYARQAGGFPTAPMEPLEEVYYALSQVRTQVDTGKLSLLLTTTASAWTGARESGTLTAAQVAELLARPETESYYSSRYACAYLSAQVEDKDTVVWYLDRQSAQERARLLRFFGVDQLCLTDSASASEELLAGLR